MTTTKAYKGLPMEGVIASWYAKTTLKDLKRHKLMASYLVKNIPADGSVLEIAPGPGYFCIELAKLGNYRITGLDISKSFVEIARKNAMKAGKKIDFREGNASDMPFASETFDLRHDASLDEIEEEIKGMHLNRFNENMVRWTFKNMLLKNAYSVVELKSMIAKTPFGEGKIRVEGIGFQAWLEK
jgi:SAM-dependent methyltransferase